MQCIQTPWILHLLLPPSDSISWLHARNSPESSPLPLYRLLIFFPTSTLLWSNLSEIIIRARAFRYLGHDFLVRINPQSHAPVYVPDSSSPSHLSNCPGDQSNYDYRRYGDNDEVDCLLWHEPPPCAGVTSGVFVSHKPLTKNATLCCITLHRRRGNLRPPEGEMSYTTRCRIELLFLFVYHCAA